MRLPICSYDGEVLAYVVNEDDVEIYLYGTRNVGSVTVEHRGGRVA